MKNYASLDEFIKDLPALAESAKDKLEGLEGLYLLEIKNSTKIYLKFDDGKLNVLTDSDEKPTCTISADGDTLLGLLQGKVNVFGAVMTGKIAVSGKADALMGFASLLK